MSAERHSTRRCQNRRTVLSSTVAGGFLALAGCLSLLENGAEVEDTAPETSEEVDFDVEIVTDEVAYPWGIAFSDDGSTMLVTEREGTLSLVDHDNGDHQSVAGTPEVYASGQGGLLDVTFHPAYPDETWVYLTYAASDDDGASATHLGRGRLEESEPALESFEQLFVVEPFVDSTAHFGSRVVFGDDGMVYLTSGDRGFKDFGPDHVSQDTTNAIGTTLRLEPDGTVPDDNPFVDDDDVLDAIYSYGHRNAQGMVVHPETGDIWQSEHGEEDGDEINVIEAGGNYGWPIAHTGCEYSTDDPVGADPRELDDVVDPVYFWECGTGGFPPAGMTIYDGDAFPDWHGDLFVGNLAGQYMGRFTLEGTVVDGVEALLEGRGWRVRDVEVEPGTGYLYVAVDSDRGPVVRLRPQSD
ncbi:PQQ-dependent sugar dehydrogenase [Halobacteria archaeon AArc-curdl1]|uniref:PQQ-dependent sugar dehydrogenase n=1 Tax=Natronosalvus hydrolyticus TaxID=2979988 RepID=A0AAP3E8E3_9EURY|nr:PQQ-dependent sugar dehydrogenase [Halobacteria archaeon AArc-curdl1]